MDKDIICNIRMLQKLIQHNCIYKKDFNHLNLEKYINNLIVSGFDIHIHKYIYTLSSIPNKIHPWLLRAYLNKKLFYTPIYHFHNVVSTMDKASELISNIPNIQFPFIVIANSQTHGRGQWGRKWESASHKNLYVSLAFRPYINFHNHNQKLIFLFHSFASFRVTCF